MEQQVAELRDIIDSSMHTKRASTLKLETAMNALNLSKTDAKQFIQVYALTPDLLHSLADTSAGTYAFLDGSSFRTMSWHCFHFEFLLPQSCYNHAPDV